VMRKDAPATHATSWNAGHPNTRPAHRGLDQTILDSRMAREQADLWSPGDLNP
jgi:hypothetical protein